jgi:hypothetical protein
LFITCGRTADKILKKWGGESERERERERERKKIIRRRNLRNSLSSFTD